MTVDVLAAARRRLQSGPDDPTDSGDTAWLLVCTAMVMLMVPALSIFYGGLMHARAMQHTMMLSFVSFLTTALVWSLIGALPWRRRARVGATGQRCSRGCASQHCASRASLPPLSPPPTPRTHAAAGYSLAFAPNPNAGADPWIGGTLYGAFDSRDKVRMGTDVSEIAFFCFQMAFCAITAAVVSGSVVGRITLFGWAAFSAVWTVFVYVPLARWIFYPKGWLAA
jgi:ammonium transporter, Amt family